MPRSDQNPLTPWLIQLVGPILIMGMVGSLVFFLVEVLYRGPHATRLCVVLGLFTVAAVLVSRVSIQEGFGRASFFGVALAMATLLTSTAIVDFDYGSKIFEPISISILIGVVMWSSSKLTWDCTVVDSSRDVSASGLLDFAARRFRPPERLEKVDGERSSAESRTAETETHSENSQLGVGVVTKLFSKAGRKNTPGLWVFYFSLFALPIFGVGQWFVVSDSTWGDSWIFLLFAVYLGSGLGLLMVTSLLGLNRYLVRRNLPLPYPIAHGWLVLGSLFAILIMGLVVVVPRPNLAERTSDALAWFSSSNRRASDMAVGRDGQQVAPDGNSSVRSDSGQKIPGAQGKTGGPQSSDQASQSQAGEGEGQGSSGQKSGQDSGQDDRNGNTNDPKQGRGSNGEGSTGQKSGSPSDSSGQESSSQSPDSSGDSPSGQPDSANADATENSGDRSQQSNRERQGRDREGQSAPAGQPSGAPGQEGAEVNREDSAEEDEREKGEGQSAEASAEDAPNGQSGSGSALTEGNAGSSAPPPVSPEFSSLLATLGKSLVFLIGLVALAVLVWLYRDELAEFWAKLFGGKKQKQVDARAVPEKRLRKPKFSDFPDPFRTGRESKWTERQLIQYTYAALEAWARGRQYEKEPDETPYEFVKQIQVFDRVVGHQAVELAHLYCRAEYSQQAVRRSELKPLLKLWQEMTTRSMVSV